MSPWHDIEIESAFSDDYCITGVIEMTSRTSNKLECVKDIAFNPIMQDTRINKETNEYELRRFG